MKRFKVLSLAALVAFAACDEGSPPLIEPTPTGTISGVVTIEGQAASGVSVTLSSGASATTDGSGAYSFAGVNAGAYTVSISGFASDASFTSTAKAATITATGQVVTVNFDGAYVRTSAILGSVTAGGQPLAGVSVSIGSASVNTDSNGQYAFSGLRAGTYTVTISGFNAGQYTFASTSSTVTLGVGESKVAPFIGQLIATASISGAVTIDGGAAAGVTATLSTGATATTDAAGAYAFTNLTAGNYVVTISGYPTDAQFESVAKPVVVTSAGSTVTANFAGAFIKTSTIVGTVSVSGTGIGGVKVTLNTGASVNTDANGQYAFAALRAGTYTVTISGWDATNYTFATTSGDVTVATGESAILNFSGAYVATAQITGSLFIDEAAPNGTFDSTEDKLAVAGITIQAEGGAVNNLFTTTTDANGDFMFENLVAGTYRLTILGVTGAPLNAALPGNVAFRAGASTSQLVVVGVGGNQTANWPFNISRQAITVYAYRGTTANPQAAPIAGSTMWLYDTYANASAGLAAGRLTTTIGTTGADGSVTFRFLRTADIGPGGTARDNIVFARLVSHPALHVPDASQPVGSVIEIKYNAKDSTSVAQEDFRALASQVILKTHIGEIDSDTLALWNVVARARRDTVGATLTLTDVSNASGDAVYTMTAASLAGAGGSDGILPDTFWIRLSTTQPVPTHPWVSAADGNEGTAANRYLRYIWDGTQNPTDTVVMGDLRVRYTLSDVTVRVHRELDDSTNSPTYTAGDGFASVTAINVQLYRLNANGTKTSVGGPTAAAAGTGLVTFPNIDVTFPYEVRARSVDANLNVLNDTVVAVSLDGSDEFYTDRTLQGSTAAFNSTFAIKANNNTVQGQVLAADGTAAQDVIVTLTPTADNIQGSAAMVDTTLASGWYTFTGVIEGPYTVSVGNIDGTWEFFTTLILPTSGSEANSSATAGTRDVTGYGGVSTANFRATRMDTRILGNIVNDRDLDQTTLDPNEALEGAVVRLYRDGSGAVGFDTLVAEQTTDINGRYSFTGLREGRYVARYISGGNNVLVLRAIAKDTTVVTTAAAAGTGAQNTRTVGTHTHTVANFLPAWNYTTSSLAANPIGDPDFTFLFTNTTVQGTVKTGGGVAIPGMTISMRRCNDSTGKTVTSPPTGADVCTTYLGTTVNMSSDASGAFQFPNLVEGVYEIRPQPTTVAGWTTSTPAQILYITVDSGDIENFNFVIS